MPDFPHRRHSDDIIRVHTSRREYREQLQRDLEAFLAQGGGVQHVAEGESGLDDHGHVKSVSWRMQNKKQRKKGLPIRLGTAKDGVVTQND